MRLLFAGTPEVALPSLRALLASDHEVVAVLTRPDTRKGRGRDRRRQPGGRGRPCRGHHRADAAARCGTRGWRRRSRRSTSTPHRSWRTAVWSRPTSSTFRGTAGSTCTSPSCRRGGAPHPCSAPSSPATRSRGPASSSSRPVSTPARSTARSPSRSARATPPATSSGASPIPAASCSCRSSTPSPTGPPGPSRSLSDGVSLAPKLEVEDAHVRWSDPALAVDRLIRGCTPAPGAWTTTPAGSRLKLRPVTPRTDVDRPAAR